jgi:hypothetical protein
MDKTEFDSIPTISEQELLNDKEFMLLTIAGGIDEQEGAFVNWLDGCMEGCVVLKGQESTHSAFVVFSDCEGKRKKFQFPPSFAGTDTWLKLLTKIAEKRLQITLL